MIGDWRDHRVLITGAAGFLGRRMRTLLTEAGATVAGYDLAPGEPPWLQGSVTEFNQVRRAFMEHEPDTVMHLAGYSHILASQQAGYVAWDVNVRGTATVLDACRWYQEHAYRLTAVVVSSSNHVYGNLRDRNRGVDQPWTEADALCPKDIYGASKAACDLAARCYAHAYGLPVIPLRHVNAYGPSDPHRSHLVTGTIRAALAGQPIRLRGNGASVKGYLFEDDVVEAYVRAAECLWAQPMLAGRPFNVAPESPIAVRDLVQMIVDVLGEAREVICQHEDRSQDDYVEHLDSTRFRALGWHDEVSLRDGLARTVRAFSE